MSWFRPFKICGAPTAAIFLFFAVVTPNLRADETMAVNLADEVSNPAKNLARMNCGATINLVGNDGRIVAVTDKNSSPNHLLFDDDTLSYPLAEGDTTFVLSFPRVSTLDRFMFVNENASAAGEMSIAVSNYRLAAQSPKWNEVSSGTPFTGKRLFDLSLLGTEARFVKLTFHVTKAGSIAGLGLYGAQSLQKFAAARQPSVVRINNTAAARRLEDLLNFNFANLYARASVVFVSSGIEEYAKRMIDDNVATAFEFAPGDPAPTVIVELAEQERLHRVSAVYKMEKGRLDVYLLENLNDDRGDLTGAKPVASVTDTDGGGKAAVDFDPHGARYVALRWTPSDTLAPHGFEVAEVSAFGEMSLTMLSTQELPDIHDNDSMGLVSPPLVFQPPVVPLVSP